MPNLREKVAKLIAEKIAHEADYQGDYCSYDENNPLKVFHVDGVIDQLTIADAVIRFLERKGPGA